MPYKRRLYPLGAAALLFIYHNTFAVSLGGLADNLLSPTRGITQLMYGVSYVAGAGMLIMSLIQYKAHRDNPTQVRLGTPIAFFIFAWVFLLLPYIASHSSASEYVDAAEQVEQQNAKAPFESDQHNAASQAQRPAEHARTPARNQALPPPPPSEDKDWYQ